MGERDMKLTFNSLYEIRNIVVPELEKTWKNNFQFSLWDSKGAIHYIDVIPLNELSILSMRFVVEAKYQDRWIVKIAFNSLYEIL